MTPLGQFRAIPGGRLTTGELTALFEDRVPWLMEKFPIFDRKDNRVGWDAGGLRDYLVRRCGEEGLFDPEGHIREGGTWRHEGEGIVAHLGDRLRVIEGDGLIGTLKDCELGRYGDQVYAASMTRPARPVDKLAGDKAGGQLYDMLRRWNYSRPQIDPMLVLGWIGCAFYAGALDWRPAMWISGGPETGKSSLQMLIEAVEGGAPRGILSLSGTTAAALRQMLSRRSMPVLLDEMENNPDKRVGMQELIEILRLAATRGQGGIGRGSAEQVATLSHIDAVCMALSITRPPLLPQDAQRITRIDLKALDALAEGEAPPREWIARAGRLSQPLYNRMLACWGLFLGIHDRMRGALIKAHHSNRSADQYAALMAGARVMLSFAAPPDEWYGEWAAKLPIETGSDDGAELQAQWVRCLLRVLSGQGAGFAGGERTLIGELIPGAVEQESGDAQNKLRRAGVAVQWERGEDGAVVKYLAIANHHPELERIFLGSPWEGRAGSTSPWRQALADCPGAITGAQVSFAGLKARAILLPMDEVKPMLGY